MTKPRKITVRTLAIDITGCTITDAAAKRQTKLQKFLDDLEDEGLSVITITETFGTWTQTAKDAWGTRFEQQGTVYTVLCCRDTP